MRGRCRKKVHMKPPKNPQYILFGGTFVLANKLQAMGDHIVDGLSTKQWFLLRNTIGLPNDPPPTISRIAREVDSTRQNVTKMLEVLEREGYVMIMKNASDHRSLGVCVTSKGEERMKQAPKLAESFFSRLYEGIAPEDCETAGKVLLQMVANLQKMQEEQHEK